MNLSMRAILAAVMAVVATEASAAGNKWMASLDPALPLSQISIPGTHDSMALHEPVPGTAKCQNLTLTQQLNAGVRFLDIRCRHVSDAFLIHHGSISQKANFDDVIDAVAAFLKANPSECVILSVKEEHTASGNTRSFEQTFDSYVAKNPNRWNLGASIPTIGSAKGRITLFRRFAASQTPKGIDASVWPDNTSFVSSAISVQDYYSVSDNDTKWKQIEAQFEQAQKSRADTLVLNFCSGYQSKLFGIPNIPAVSDDINARLAAYLKTSRPDRAGIVLMDFIDSRHCESIYNRPMPGRASR